MSWRYVGETTGDSMVGGPTRIMIADLELSAEGRALVEEGTPEEWVRAHGGDLLEPDPFSKRLAAALMQQRPSLTLDPDDMTRICQEAQRG